jgi:hypothetical protein
MSFCFLLDEPPIHRVTLLEQIPEVFAITQEPVFVFSHPGAPFLSDSHVASLLYTS